MNSQRNCFLRTVLLTLALAGIWLGGVLAASAASVSLKTSDGLTAPEATSWTSATNWSDGLAPNAGSDYFTGGYTLRTPGVSLNAAGTNPPAFAGNSLSIDAGGQLLIKHYGNFTNNALILNGGLMSLGADFLVTNYGTIWFNGAANSAIYTAIGTLNRSIDIKSAIVSTNSGAGVLTISNIWGGLGGAYGVVLSGANTFTNVLVINNAEVKLNSATALGSTAGGTIITNGGMLDLNSISAGTEPVTISGGGTNGIVGAVVNNGASDISDGLRGPVTLAGDVVFGTLHRWDIMGTFTANGYKLTKVGGNQLCFNNSSANTDLGNIDVQAGTLTFFGGAGMGLSGSLLSVWTGANLNYWGSGTWNKTMSFTNASMNNGSGGAVINQGPITLNGTVNFNPSSGTFTQNGSINGSGSLNKGAASIMTLNATNTYTGTTLVSGGTLAVGVNGSISNSPSITVASNCLFDVSAVSGGFALNTSQALYCSGVVTGSVTVAANAIVGPGTDGTTGTMIVTNGNLNLPGGSKLRFDLANTNAVGGGTNDLIVVNGALNLSGTIPVNLTLISGQPVLGLPYTIIRYSGARTGGATNLVATGTHYTATFDDTTTNEIRVTLSGGSSLVWQGNVAPTNWDVGTSSNWLSGGISNVFYAGDNVAFDNTATNFIANLVGTLSPASILVNSTNSFTWAGSGILSGSATLLKTNSGTLTIAPTNTAFTAYNGLIVVNGGILKITTNLALGSTTAGTIITNGGTLDVNGKANITEPIFVRDAGLTNGGAIVSSVTIYNDGLRGPVTLLGPTTLGGPGRWDMPGPATMIGNGYKLTKVSANEIYMNGTGDLGVGDIDLTAGQLTLGGNTTLGLVANTMTVFSAGTLGFYGSTANPVTKNFVFQNGANCQDNNLNAYMSGTITISGTPNFGAAAGLLLTLNAPISGTGTLNKNNPGSVVLNGTNTYSGNTIISGGRLALGTYASISNTPVINIASGSVFDVTALAGAGGFTLLSNQVLQGSGMVTGQVNVASGAVVQAGTDNAPGTLSVSNGTIALSLSAGAKMRFELSSSATTPGGGTNSLVTVMGGLAQSTPTTIYFNFMGGSPVLGSPYTLIRFSGGNFGVAAANFAAVSHYTATFDTTTAPGEVRVTFSGAGTNLLWKGDGLANSWDNGLTTNWLNLGLPALFYGGDSVTFDDTGSNNVAVTLVGSVTPNTTTVSASKDYTLAGAGILSGTLLKQGLGTLTLSNANAYSGNTFVSGGTVRQGNASALGNSPTIVVTNGGTVDLNGITSVMGRTYIIGGSGPDGNGAIKNTSTTPVYGANGGVKNLFLTNNATVGTIGGGINDAGRFDIGNGGGVDGGGFTLTKVGASGIAMQGGTTNLAQLVINNGMVWSEGVNSNLGASVVINSPGKVGSNARTNNAPMTFNGGTLAAINGASWWLGTITLNGNTFVDTGVPYTGYAGSDIYVCGKITGSGVLTKINTNSLYLTNANDYVGGTLVATNSGNLYLGNNTPFGSVLGPITNHSALYYYRSDAFTLSNALYGGGSLNLRTGGGMTVDNNALINISGAIYVGQSSYGKLIIQPGASITAFALLLGNPTSIAGDVVQLGGTVNSTDATGNNFRIGHWGTETSTYLMGGGTLNVAGSLNVGWDGTGIMRQTNGTVTALSLNVPGSGHSGGGSIYALEGGTLQIGANGIAYGGGTPKIFLGGGTVAASSAWSSAAAMFLTGTNGNTTFDTGPYLVTLSGAQSSAGLAGGLVKAGSGTLVLSGNNQYTGDTVVSNGVLLANGVVGTNVGNVNVYGGTLAGSGVVRSPITVFSGGTLAAGAIGAAGTLTVSNNATFNNSGLLSFDLANVTTVGGGTNDLIDVKNTLTLGSPVLVNFLFLNGAPALGVPYTIAKYGTLSGSVANLQLASSSHYTATFDNATPGEIHVTFTGNANMTWRGDGVNNLWDTGTTLDWWNGAALSYFYAEDSVTFDNTGSNTPPVALVGTLSPAAVLVNAAQDYVFAGSGKISGITPLTKQGAGLLSINTTNDYTGVTTIGGGTVSVPWLANSFLPSPIGAANNTASSLLISNGGVLQYTGGNVSVDRAFTLGVGGGAIVVTNSSATLTVSGASTGPGGLTKTGPGTLAFTANQNYSNATVISGGKLSVATGKLYAAGNWQNVMITVSNGGIWEVGGWADADTYNPAQLSFGAGNLMLNNGTIRYVATSAAANNFDRGFTIGAGGATLEAASALTWNLADMSRGYVLAGNGGVLTLTGSSNGNITMVIPGTGGLLKTGTGTWSLGPTNATRNTYTGGTVVSSGVLALNVGGATGCIRNNLTVLPGATLLSQANDSWGYTVGSQVTNVNVTGGSVFHTPGNNLTVSGVVLNLTGGYIGATNTGGRIDLMGATVVNTFATNTSSIIGGVNLYLRQANNAFNVADGAAAVDLQVTAPINEVAATYGITKAGLGLMRLEGTNTYSGNTVVNGGTLALGTFGSIANSAQISVNSNGIFDVTLSGGFTLGNGKSVAGSNGIIVGNFSVSSNATVSPAGYAAGGTLTFSNNLTLANGSLINWNLANTTGIGGGTNDLLNVVGNLVLNGPVTLTIFPLNPTLAVGTYRLFNYGGSLSGIANLVVSNSVAGTRYTFTVDTSSPNQVNLIVGSSASSGLVWKGLPASQNWNLADSNWMNGASFDRFFNVDPVLFNDTAAYFTVGLPVTVQPGGITIDATSTYALSGMGKITGTTPITKLNTGLFTLSGTNDFTGTIVVDNGILRVGNSNALGAVSGAVYVTNNGTLDVNGFNNTDKPIFARGGGFTNGGAIINIPNAGGTIEALHFVTLLGDTYFGGVNRWDIRGGATRKLTGNGYTLTKVGTGYIALVDTAETDLGDIVLNNGTFSMEGNATLGRTTNTIYVNPGSILQIYSANVGAGYNKNFALNGGTIYKNSGEATLLGAAVLSATNTIQVASYNGSNFWMRGPISGSGSLLKIDLGTLFLGGTNYYTGSTLISTGRLALLTNASLASTNIVVATNGTLDVTAQTGYSLLAGQTLSGNGTVLGNLTNSGATIQPGVLVGTLTLNSNLVLNGGALVFDLGSVTTEGGGINDLLNVGRDLNLAAPTIIGLNTGPIDPHNPYTLINYAGALLGSTNNLILTNNSRYTFALDFSVTNKVRVAVTGGSAANLLWVGDTGGNSQADWDVTLTADWDGYNYYYQGDVVSFTDNAPTSYSVNLVGSLLPTLANVVAGVGYDYTFVGSGKLSGPGSWTKSGLNSLFIANTGLNDYYGATLIEGGLLQIGTNNSTVGNLSPNTVVIITNSMYEGDPIVGTLAFSHSDNVTVGNRIVGPGSLVQQGTGLLALSGNNASFTGSITANAGTLRVGSATALGSIAGGTTVNPGATLDINGYNLGDEAVTLAGAGVGGTGALINSGAVQMNALRLVTLAGDTTFGVASNRYDIRSSTNNGPASLSSGGQPYNITKVGNGQLDFVEMNMDPAVSNITVAAGILEFASLGYGVTNFAGNPNGTLTLSSNATLNLWNLSNVFNKPLVMNAGSAVSNIAGNATLMARVTLANNANMSAAGTLTLSNAVDGAGRLTKIGGGLLVLNADNTYTGGTLVNGGNLQIGNGAGTGSVLGNITNTIASSIYFWNTNASVMAGNIINVNGIIQQNSGSGPLRLAGINVAGSLRAQSGNLANAITLASGTSNYFGYIGVGPTPSGSLIIEPNSTVMVAGNYMMGEQFGQTGRVVQAGGDITVTGQYRLGHWGNNISTYDMNGGTLTLTGTPGTNVVNPSGVAEANGVLYVGIDGVGWFTQRGGVITTPSLVMDNRGPTTLGAAVNTYSMEGGSINIGGWGIKSGSFDANTTYQINLGGGTVAASTNWSSVLNMTLTGTNGNVTFDTATWSNQLSGQLTGNGGLKKVGSGTLVLSGANSYFGTTVVSNGTLFYNGSLGLGAGAVTVAGGTLGGTGTLNAPVTVQAAGTLAPGIGIGWIGRLAISNTVNLGGTTVMKVNKAGSLTSDLINGVSTLTYGGTLTVQASGTALAAGDSIKLFDATTYTGGFTAISPATPGIGIVWDMSRLLADGTLSVVSSSAPFSCFWTNKQGGTWLVPQNWSSWIVPQGISATANFSTISLNSDVTVTLDSDRLIGNLLFDDQSGTKHNWTLTAGSGGVLTLAVSNGSPVINVGSAATTISAAVAGTNGLTKSGSGALLLNGTNTYTGDTIVSAGTLGGTGIIMGPVTVQATAALSPGIGIEWLGRMAISNTLTLAGTTVMDLNKASGTCDQVVGLTTVTYGGTLQVTNLAGTLAAGDSFKLFDATNYTGSFAAISPSIPGIGIVWDLSYLPVDGTLRVAAGSQIITGQVALDGYVGLLGNGLGVRDVAFSVSDGTSFTNRTVQTLTFSNGVATYTLSVPVATVRLGAKTAWNLRKVQSVTFVSGSAVVNFTGAQTLPAGDLDDSNMVDFTDYFALVAAWYQNVPAADLDGNGIVDLDDYFLLANHWNESGQSE